MLRSRGLVVHVDPQLSSERLGQKTLAYGELAARHADLVTLASAADEKAFEGFYTDPENHPGGTRKITVDDGTIGVFRQAWIDGGGGAGEPANYTLPALVKGDRIIADFSVPPKSAPPKYAAFKGKRTERGIEWEDGNVWPKGQHKHQD